MKIGVFDSGIGGKSVANTIALALPDHEVVFKNDSQNVPYGNRTVSDIYELCLPIIQSLEQAGCVAIVVACNTVSTNLITKLRHATTVPLIAMEPMVKPAAALSKSHVIAVCATPRTLSSKRYNHLKEAYAPTTTVLEPDCNDWSHLIETQQIDRIHVAEQVEGSIAQGADVIVLGCTHYHWIEELIVEVAAGRAVVIQPEQPVLNQLKRVLARQQ